MTTTLAQIRTAIAGKISGVAGTGVVHEYERYAKSMSELATEYYYGAAPNKRLHGWHVRRVGTREILVDTDRWSIYHRWRLRGFMSLDDADGSEKLFDTEIELIRDAFRADDTLGSLVFSLQSPEGEIGAQVLRSDPALFAGVLCHAVELGLTTQHMVP